MGALLLAESFDRSPPEEPAEQPVAAPPPPGDWWDELGRHVESSVELAVVGALGGMVELDRAAFVERVRPKLREAAAHFESDAGQGLFHKALALGRAHVGSLAASMTRSLETESPRRVEIERMQRRLESLETSMGFEAMTELCEAVEQAAEPDVNVERDQPRRRARERDDGVLL